MKDYLLFAGEADEVKAVEKSLRRAWRRDASNIWPSHCESPRFVEGRVYGIAVEKGLHHDTYYVLSASNAARMLMEVCNEKADA